MGDSMDKIVEQTGGFILVMGNPSRRRKKF